MQWKSRSHSKKKHCINFFLSISPLGPFQVAWVQFSVNAILQGYSVQFKATFTFFFSIARDRIILEIRKRCQTVCFYAFWYVMLSVMVTLGFIDVAKIFRDGSSDRPGGPSYGGPRGRHGLQRGPIGSWSRASATPSAPKGIGFWLGPLAHWKSSTGCRRPHMYTKKICYGYSV